MKIKKCSDVLGNKKVSCLQNELIDKAIFRDDLSKTLDNIRYRYEMSIGTLALDCFDSFLKVQEVAAQIREIQNDSKDIESYHFMKLEHDTFMEEAKFKAKKESLNHQETINNYYLNVLDDEKNARFNELYRFVNQRLNLDINPYLTTEELTLWHEAQEKYMENDLLGLERLINQYERLEIVSQFDYNNLNDNELSEYVEHLNIAIDTIDEEIAVYSDPNNHQFWTDMINEKEVKMIIKDKIKTYHNIITLMKNSYDTN